MLSRNFVFENYIEFPLQRVDGKLVITLASVIVKRLKFVVMMTWLELHATPDMLFVTRETRTKTVLPTKMSLLRRKELSLGHIDKRRAPRFECFSIINHH